MPPLSARSVIVQPRIVRQQGGTRPASQPVPRELSTPNASCCPMIHVSLEQPQPLKNKNIMLLTSRFVSFTGRSWLASAEIFVARIAQFGMTHLGL